MATTKKAIIQTISSLNLSPKENNKRRFTETFLSHFRRTFWITPTANTYEKKHSVERRKTTFPFVCMSCYSLARVESLMGWRVKNIMNKIKSKDGRISRLISIQSLDRFIFDFFFRLLLTLIARSFLHQLLIYRVVLFSTFVLPSRTHNLLP